MVPPQQALFGHFRHHAADRLGCYGKLVRQFLNAGIAAAAAQGIQDGGMPALPAHR
jgi:hypothetical protein